MEKHQSSSARDGAQYFNNAHNLIIHHPSFANIETHNHIASDTSASALRWLGKRVMPGAEFDSSERDPPPRCHPGTRLSIVQRIRAWLRNADRLKNLLWLHGPAGVGKSAIIQSLAESESKVNGVIATLSFSATNSRNDPNRIFTTLAYQFAVKDSSYRAYVVELMSQDPRSLDKATSEQFRKLIVEPFTQQGIGGGSAPWIVLLDGLDECRPPDARSQAETSSERAQCEIIKLISTFVLEYPSVPLLWVISSRPESHLRAFFDRGDVRTAHWEEEVPIDSDEACQDVERYLRSEFENIRQQYPYHISSVSPWPYEEHISIITRSALGHFVFATTVTKFVEDPDIGDPVAQLEQILDIISNPDVHLENDPLAALNALYTSIFQRINAAVLPLTKRLLGYYLWEYIWPSAHASLLIVACNVLNIEQHQAYGALQKLHAVLRIPHPADAGSQRLKFLHKSFVDYVRGSHQFSISTTDMVAGPWLCSIRVLNQAVVPNKPTPDPSNISLSWRPLETSEEVQLQRMVYATAVQLFGDLVRRAERETILDRIQLIDFTRIIGEYLILGMNDFMIFSFFETLMHLPDTAPADLRGFMRSINLGDVDITRIRNDKLAYYGFSCTAIIDEMDNVYWPLGSSAFYQHPEAKNALQSYRFVPHVNELLHLDLQNPISQSVEPYPALSALLDRLRTRQKQYPLVRATVLGRDPSKSCIIFKCNHPPEEALPDELNIIFEPDAEDSRMSEEIFVFPYSW